MNEDLRTTYSWVKGSRARVLAWLESLPPEVFTREHPDFAYGSLRNIGEHVVSCWLSWTGVRGLGLSFAHLEEREVADVAALRALYQVVDDVIQRALSEFVNLDAPLNVEMRGQSLRVTQRWLLMHPMTHEFHHKGQMLALGRILGWPYPPDSDTDLPLPFGEFPAPLL